MHPLPSGWKEHIDAQRQIYYVDEVRLMRIRGYETPISEKLLEFFRRKLRNITSDTKFFLSALRRRGSRFGSIRLPMLSFMGWPFVAIQRLP